MDKLVSIKADTLEELERQVQKQISYEAGYDRRLTTMSHVAVPIDGRFGCATYHAFLVFREYRFA